MREGKATPEEVARTLLSGSKEAFEKTRAAGDPVTGEPVAAPPKSFGKYEILGEIARGGMGVVYRAREAKLNRVVALKVLLAGEGASEEQIQRFTGEARAAAALQHPGIVQIFDVGEERGVHYFAMEYVEGIALDRLLKRDGPLPPMQALRVVREVARALQFAHDKGIIHRDIKPGNILMASMPETSSALERSADAFVSLERVKLSDFGLAKDLSAESSLTISGNLLGTPGYMSPEQAAGRTSETDARSDVFSLGAVAYHALTGEMPFGGATIADVLTNIRTTDPRPMRTLRAGLHRDVEIIVGKALAREKERRYQSAGELADDIDRYLRGEAIRAAPPSIVYRVTRFAQRHRAAVFAACVCLITVASAGGGTVWRSVAARRDRVEKARHHSAEALRLSREGRFDESYVALGLAEALDPGLPETVRTRAEIRFANASAQVEGMARQGNWEGAKAVLAAFADARGNPEFAALARRVAGTATLEVQAAAGAVEVDLGACVPGVVWDEETFPAIDAARAAGLCAPLGPAPIARRDIVFGDHMVVLSAGGRAVRVIFVRAARNAEVTLEHRVRVFVAESGATEPVVPDLSLARPGNTLEFGNGTWSLPKITVPGLLIRSSSGAGATFVPPADGKGAAFRAVEAHGISVRGVAIAVRPGKGDRGFHFTRTFRPSISRAHIRGNGVHLDECEDWLARDLDIEVAAGPSLDAGSSPRGLALRVSARGGGWTVFQIAAPDCRVVLCRAAEGQRCGFHSQSDGTRFEACEVRDCSEVGIAVENGSGQVVRDCLVLRCGTAQKIGTSGAIISAEARDAEVVHNTVVAGKTSGLYVLNGSGRFDDNIVTGIRPGLAFRWFCWGGSIDRALVWDCDNFAGVVQNRCVTLAELREGQKSGLIEFKHIFKEALEADPRFINPAKEDYRPGEGSPAQGSATDGDDLGVRWTLVDALRKKDDRALVLRENAAWHAGLALQSASKNPDSSRAELARAKALAADAPGIAEAERALAR